MMFCGVDGRFSFDFEFLWTCERDPVTASTCRESNRARTPTCDTNGVPAPSRKLTVLTQGYGEADCFLFFLDNTGYATGA